ncbi:non-homologous end-joining DNA ligase [Streptomyces sp. NPDC127106]|uniref:non-homologous end-joining DNA ligase n=1 Tax=Streptomyces sp. NPDC127106 TaxID=3345360 RepID=UPI00362EEDCE
MTAAATATATAGATKDVRVGGHTVEVSRPGKLLFPGDGFTKADLVDYYHRLAGRMLPHLPGRPLVSERHPDGIDGSGFLQKDVPDHFPGWLARVELPKADGTVTYALCEDTASLLYLAGQACVTLHRWLSRADRPDHPDRLVFDLDPPGRGDDFGAVRRAAQRLHALLEELQLPSLPMTTGSRGLHFVVPLLRREPFDEVRALAREVAEVLAERYADELTTAPRKRDRGGRLYLDVQRNAYGQTAVAPYAVRARPGAPVAAPVDWEELDDPELTARRWTLTDADRLLDRDPWQGAPRGRSPAAARRRLAELRNGS